MLWAQACPLPHPTASTCVAPGRWPVLRCLGVDTSPGQPRQSLMVRRHRHHSFPSLSVPRGDLLGPLLLGGTQAPALGGTQWRPLPSGFSWEPCLNRPHSQARGVQLCFWKAPPWAAPGLHTTLHPSQKQVSATCPSENWQLGQSRPLAGELPAQPWIPRERFSVIPDSLASPSLLRAGLGVLIHYTDGKIKAQKEGLLHGTNRGQALGVLELS